MTGWSVRVERGWRDRVPPEVAKVVRLHEGPGKFGVLCTRTESRQADAQGSSDVLFQGQTRDMEAVALVLHALRQFLAHLDRPEVDATSLIFVNLNPRASSVSPRPEGFVGAAPSLPDALRWFCEGVV